MAFLHARPASVIVDVVYWLYDMYIYIYGGMMRRVALCACIIIVYESTFHERFTTKIRVDFNKGPSITVSYSPFLSPALMMAIIKACCFSQELSLAVRVYKSLSILKRFLSTLSSAG